jgi:hypothetical protein
VQSATRQTELLMLLLLVLHVEASKALRVLLGC